MTETMTNAAGRRVVAADTAEELGEVKGFVIDATATTIDAIHIAGRGKKATVVPWSSISSFGDDAVMVNQAEQTAQAGSDREVESVKGQIAMRGSRILTTHGFEDGTVDDATFDASTGAITAVTGTNGTIDGSRLRSLGTYALVVDAT